MRARYSPRLIPALLLVGALGHGLPPAASRAELPGQVSVHPTYPSFLFYHLGGPFFLAGPGDPEGFLYRGTQNPDGTRNGDQQALLDKLIPTGANSIYLMAVRSHGGDGDATQNPFVDNDPARGLNDAVLDQWAGWFDQMDAAGITIFFFFYDDGALIWDTGDGVGAAEADFIRGLVDRFEGYRHLIWVVAEEYQERYTAARVSAIAAQIKSADDHDHPVAVHKLSGLDFSEFADDPALDQYAIQYNVGSAQEIHDGLELAWADAAGRYNLNMSEAAAWGTGATSRHKAWAAAMAGAYVMVYQMDIAGTAVADLEDLGRLRAHMEATDFYTMEPRDDLVAGDTDYVLAREGKSYILYARQGAGALGLQDLHAGRYRRRWLDIPTGFEITEEDVDLAAGLQSWARPGGIGPEAAVYALRLDGPNDRPETLDQSLTTFESTPLPVTLAYMDPDGPGPYSWSIDSGPSNGSLSGVAPDLTYTADPGFLGSDSLTWTVDDGIDASTPATVTIAVVDSPPPSSTTELFADDFDRPDSAAVGNGWLELETSGQAGIDLQSLAFDSVDEVERPLVRHSFAAQTGGTLTWSFDLAFKRTGSEGAYAFHMQLGEGAAMSDSLPDAAGVAVNLLWGGPNLGFSGHERLGYTVGGSPTELATVSGLHTITVEADLDAATLEILVDGSSVATGVPFENPVPIDTVRFFADGLNAQNFSDRWVDDVLIESPCAAADGVDLTLSNDTVTSTESYEVCGTIDVGPSWAVAPSGDVTLDAGSAVVFGNGVTIDDGGRLTVGTTGG